MGVNTEAHTTVHVHTRNRGRDHDYSVVMTKIVETSHVYELGKNQIHKATCDMGNQTCPSILGNSHMYQQKADAETKTTVKYYNGLQNQ